MRHSRRTGPPLRNLTKSRPSATGASSTLGRWSAARSRRPSSSATSAGYPDGKRGSHDHHGIFGEIRFKATGDSMLPRCGGSGGSDQCSILNSHPKGEAAACVRAVLIEAEAIRQSSLFSARMSTSNSGAIKELLAMMRIQTAVSLSSFCTIRIL